MRIVVLIGALCMLVLSLLFMLGIEEEKNVPTVSAKPIASVSVVEVEAKTHSAYFYATARLKAKESLKVSAPLSGEIIFKSSKLIEGGIVKKGEKLLALEKITYIVALNEAKYRVEEAQYEYLKEDKRYKQALKDWKRLGTGKPSNLALNIPQRKLAKSNLVLAKSLLKQNKMRLEKTDIKAPFSGYITKNEVATLGNIGQGEILFEMASNETLLGSIVLNDKEWRLLDRSWKNSLVEVERLNDHHKAKAKLTHGGMYVSSSLYRLYFSLKENSFVLGDFIKVSLPTNKIAKSISIASTAVTANGLLWYVDRSNTLQNFKAKALLPQEKHTLVSLPAFINSQTLKIVLMPLGSFYRGMRVVPMQKSK